MTTNQRGRRASWGSQAAWRVNRIGLSGPRQGRGRGQAHAPLCGASSARTSQWPSGPCETTMHHHPRRLYTDTQIVGGAGLHSVERMDSRRRSERAPLWPSLRPHSAPYSQLLGLVFVRTEASADQVPQLPLRFLLTELRRHRRWCWLWVWHAKQPLNHLGRINRKIW